MAQQRTITGTVTGKDDGVPIPGVSVRVKGTQTGTSTGSDGKYSITIPTGGTELLFSSVGYLPQTRVPGQSSVLNVVLEGDSKALGEVVVTALGIVRDKAALGYSTDVVSSKELNNGRQTNLINGLTGKVPGLQIGRSGGGVNSATRITIRGQRSLTGDGQPIFVVDGIPIDNSSVLPVNSSINTVDVGNRVGDINPDDIESVTVLKGANASALYGSKAANGAIVITTKNGGNRNKKFEISFTSAFMFDKVQKLPEIQNDFGSGSELSPGGESAYDPIENTNWGPKFNGSIVQSGPTLANGHKLMIPYSAVPNNIKDFFNIGTNIQNSVALQGGNEKSSFYISFSDNHSKGVVPNDRFRRNTVKLSGTSKLSNLFNISGNVSYNKNLTNISFEGEGNNSVMNTVMNVSRQINLENFKDWKNYEFAGPTGYYNGYQPNPYYALDNNRFNSNLDRIFGNIQIGFDPYKWLNVTYHYKDFKATLILLNNIRQDDSRNLTASASAISIPGFFNLSNRIGELGGGETSTKRRLVGFAGDLTLGYKDFLFLNASLRNDISSTLPKENRSYFYPSVNTSFIFTEGINALKDNDVLSYGKVRASFSRVAGDTNPYSLAPTFGAAAGFPFGSLPGFTLSNNTPLPTLKPEFTTSYETGTELSFLKDRLGLDFTYYYTSTDNQILNLNVAPSTGYETATFNVGQVVNKGIEIAFKGKPFANPNGFSWNFNFSYTHNNSKVVSLLANSKELPLGAGDPVGTAIVGMPATVLKGTAYLRDPQGRVVVDATTGYIRTDPNLKVLGQINPKHIFGLNNTFSYKGFSLSATLDYRTGNVIYSGTKLNSIFTGSSIETIKNDRQPFIYPNSVIETSPGVFTPNTTVKTKSGNFDFWYSNYAQFAESFVIDAAFLKIRDISFAWQLPANMLKKTPFGRVSIAAVGSNILLWTPKENRYIDPEANIFGTNISQGREINGIPSSRSLGFSLNATF
eukprot:gene17558-21010_t